MQQPNPASLSVPCAGQPLDLQRAEAITKALFQLRQHCSSLVETAGRPEEIRKLTQFVAGNLLAYAEELLGAWETVQTEYVPLVQALAPILQHCLPAPAAAAAAAAPLSILPPAVNNP